MVNASAQRPAPLNSRLTSGMMVVTAVYTKAALEGQASSDYGPEAKPPGPSGAA
ncbi:hypothetical protein [Arthrobacter sp. NyZ413]|uniref:hypothetical protein n=1 Tax=Arthrobacter sp. NyZ413 TaxID=3144669 RepID=UPI003BF8E101